MARGLDDRHHRDEVPRREAQDLRRVEATAFSQAVLVALVGRGAGTVFTRRLSKPCEKFFTSSGLIGKPGSWQKVKVLTQSLSSGGLQIPGEKVPMGTLPPANMEVFRLLLVGWFSIDPRRKGKTLPPANMVWCTEPCRKTTFLLGSAFLHFHVSWWEGKWITFEWVKLRNG